MSGLSAHGIEHRVSGHDFVRAMTLVGFRFVRAMDRHVRIAKGTTELLVPQLPELDEETVVALLREADIPMTQLATLLNRLGSRDTLPVYDGAEVGSSSPWRLRVSR